jgi:hypothetical protein
MKATIELNMPENCADCDISYRDFNLFCPILEKSSFDDMFGGRCPDKGRIENCPLKIAPRFFSKEDMKKWYPEE